MTNTLRKGRGKTLTDKDIVKIINADGSVDEIAQTVGRPVNTIKRVRRDYSGLLADTIRLSVVITACVEHGLIADKRDFFHNPPEEGDIAALIGWRDWQKAKGVVLKHIEAHRAHETKVAILKDKIAQSEHRVAATEFVAETLKRGGRLH